MLVSSSVQTFAGDQSLSSINMLQTLIQAQHNNVNLFLTIINLVNNLSKGQLVIKWGHSRLRKILIRFQVPSTKPTQGSLECFKDFKNVLDEILANRAQKGCARQHGQFQPIHQNWAESAVLASMALLSPIYQDFMQYIFGILEAC